MHVYVHIPFCDSICFYCDFCRYVQSDRWRWLHRLKAEIREIDWGRIDTLYFGGGTPSVLTVDEFQAIAKLFIPHLNDPYEWTVECNPETLNLEKIQLYTQLGVNRISLGVQSFDDSLLRSLGRKHTRADIDWCIRSFRHVGISNLSVDLIYGLPDQSLEDVKNDVRIFLSYHLPHLSIYSLQIEEQSIFGKKGIQTCDEDLEADMYEVVQDMLLAAGYEHYEIGSYAKKKHYSKHNLSYWTDQDFVGIGCGASGKEQGIRYDHTNSLSAYIEKGSHRYYVDMTKEDQAFEAIMMGLRTQFGLDIPAWNKKYKSDFMATYKDVIDRHKDVLVIRDHHLICTLKGFEILHSILVDFLGND